MKKSIVKAALIAGIMGSANAASVSGTTNFRVTVPEILVLYHWNDAHLNLTAATTNDFVYDDGAGTNQLDRAITATGNAEITGTPISTTRVPAGFSSSNVINVILKKSWAVRSIATNPVKVKIATQQATLTRVGGSETISVVASSEKLVNTDATGGTSGTNEVTLPSKWTPSVGDIKFQIDLTNATASGEYNSHGTTGVPGNTPADNAKDTFKLTLTSQ